MPTDTVSCNPADNATNEPTAPCFVPSGEMAHPCNLAEYFLQNTDALLVVRIPDCKVLEANQAVVDLFGYPLSELMERGIDLFIPLEEAEIFRKAVRVAAGGIPFTMDGLRTVRRDGSSIVVSSRGMAPSGASVAFCSFTDVTEKIRLEEETRAVQTKLIQTNKMTSLGMLVSSVAHEINNPNNYIMFNASLVRDAVMDAMPVLEEFHRDNGDFTLAGLEFGEMREALPKLLEGIVEGAGRIRDIVGSLRDFSAEDASVSDTDLNQIVDGAIAMLGNSIRRSCNRFTFSRCEQEAIVSGNRLQLEQVIVNLVLNALQSLPDRTSGVTVAVTFDQRTSHAVVTVTDEGCGMSATVLRNIGRPFYFADRDRGRAGLGIAISRSIISDHGGALHFASKPGEGTVVELRLPARSSAGAAAAGTDPA